MKHLILIRPTAALVLDVYLNGTKVHTFDFTTLEGDIYSQVLLKVAVYVINEMRFGPESEVLVSQRNLAPAPDVTRDLNREIKRILINQANEAHRIEQELLNRSRSL